MPGGEIFAKILEKGMDCNIPTRFANVALPNKKKTLSGIPILTFHRITIARSTKGAVAPIMMVKISTVSVIRRKG